jgi:hypothetical protein
MPGEWSFHAYDLSTFAPLGKVRMSQWYHEDQLGVYGDGNFNATLFPLGARDHERIALQATTPTKSTIMAVRNDGRFARSEFTGWVPPGGRQLGGGTNPRLVGTGLLGYWSRQVLNNPTRLDYQNEDQSLIVALLANTAEDTVIVTDDVTGAVKQYTPGPKVVYNIGLSGKTRTQTWRLWDAKNVGEAMRQIANRIGGLDYDIITGFEAGPNGTVVPRRVIRLWYPRRGRSVADGGPVFVYGKNVRTEPLLVANENFVTSAVGLGNELDPDTQERRRIWKVNTTLLDQGYPLVTTVLDRPDITTVQGLDDQVRGHLLANAGPTTDEVLLDVDPDDATWPYGSWELGDDCRIIIPPPRAPSYETVPAQPGYITFQGGSGPETGYLSVDGVALPPDPDVEWRFECESLRPDTLDVALSTDPYFTFEDAGVSAGMVLPDGTVMSTTPVDYATLDAAGFPPPGERVQLIGTWGSAADTVAWGWRPAGPDLLDDSVAWNVGATRVVTGGEYRSSLPLSWLIGGDGVVQGYSGRVWRATLRINYADAVDLDAEHDLTDPDADVIAPTLGPLITVHGSGDWRPLLTPYVPPSLRTIDAGYPGVPWFPDGFNEDRRIIAHRWSWDTETGERLQVVCGRVWSP